MVSILIAIVGLGLLVVLHEGGHYLAARLCGMRVERFSIGFGPTLLGFKRGETTFQIAPIPLGGFVQITGLNPNEDFDRNDPYVYPNRPIWMRMFTIVAGPLANFITAVVIVMFVFLTLGVDVPGKEVVESVVPNKPAAVAGFQANDVLVEVNGTPVSAKEGQSIRNTVHKGSQTPLTVKVLRDGKPVILQVTPQKEDGEYRIGVKLAYPPEFAKVGVGEALKLAVIYPFDKSKIILVGLYNMVTGKEKAELSGPIGITKVIAKAATRGVWEYLGIIAMLSVYLGLFNLLPLPALDGGRAVFLSIETLIRKRVNPKIEAMVHTVGLVVLLGVLLVVSFNDFRGLFTKG
jgi:regulator of sigma E protease